MFETQSERCPVKLFQQYLLNLISNSPLQKIEKQLANHSARKTLLKKLKQRQVLKSEIISITGHNRIAGLDAYDSGDEVQQKQLSHFIDNHQPTASKNKYSISPNNPIIRNQSFFFFSNDDQFYQNISASNPFSFHNCTVHFHMNNQVQNVSSSVDNPRKRRRIIYSSDSFQEK